MKANELRKLSTEELVAKEKELKEDVARVKTLLCERELKAAE